MSKPQKILEAKKGAIIKNESGYCLAVRVEENETGGLIITIKRCETCE